MTTLDGPGVLAATRMGHRLTTPFERGAGTAALRLLPSGDEQIAIVESYDFGDHLARFGRMPEPRYVLVVARDVGVATTVTVTYAEPGAAEVISTVQVPAGTLAGASFAIGGLVSATARVTRLAMSPPPPDDRPDRCWALTVLLGTTAKVLWVVGGERDLLRGQAVRTVAQRHLPTAVGASLDLIGADLGVPRFPPLPHGFDPETVALYHLDDLPGASPAVADLTGAYPGRTGHHGRLVGAAQPGAAGRYALALGLRAAGAEVEVLSSPEFDIAATASATVECFVRPDPVAGDGPVLSRQPSPGEAGPGWVLAVGAFERGLDRNVRLTVSDGPHAVDIFADLSLPTGSFTHLAGVLDRAGNRVALYVDGVLRAKKPLGDGFGAIVNSAPLRIGLARGGFRGVVDEVRVSAVARTEFSPTLGEADEHYRRRLRLFHRWALPTPANLAAMLNELVGPIDGRRDPLVLDDTSATLVRGTRLIRVRPTLLRDGESIDGSGRRGVTEAEAVGTVAAEEKFDPAYLIRLDRTDVDYAPVAPRDPRPGEPAPDPHLIQLAVAGPLAELVRLAGAEPGTRGRLLIAAAFDPRSADLRATGRAILLGHSTVPPGRLAALAHRAGFGFVSLRTGPGVAGPVHAATAPGDYLAIDVASVSADAPTDLDVGQTVTLSLRPPPPPDSLVQWLIVPSGAGRGALTPARRTATLQATAAGELAVKVDVTLRGHTVSTTRSVRVGVSDLPDGATIAADGTPYALATVVERAGGYFHEGFLVRHADPRIDYGTNENNRRMQPAVTELVDALLDELARRRVTGRLAVTAAFNPAPGQPAGPAAAEGRQLTLRHSALSPGALAGVAFAVGFGHVEHAHADVIVRQAPGQLVTVRGPAGTDRSAVIELDEGATVEFTVTPTPTALREAGLTGPLPAADPRLGWVSGTFGVGRVDLRSNTLPTVRLTGVSAGTAWVQASYLIGGAPAPFTFQVRLRPDLDTPATVISKDQHDLIMNILNMLHPIGVEVITSAIREHVVEIRGDLLPVNPDYTYPKFRVRGVLPRQVKVPTRD